MYTIKDIAEKCQISQHTIRFYDKEGLLPFVSRNAAGNREFNEDDLTVIKVICCLKNSGMPIKNIKKYIDYIMQGTASIPVRLEILKDHRKTILSQIDDLKKSLTIIDLKIHRYETHDTSPISKIFDSLDD